MAWGGTINLERPAVGLLLFQEGVDTGSWLHWSPEGKVNLHHPYFIFFRLLLEVNSSLSA